MKRWLLPLLLVATTAAAQEQPARRFLDAGEAAGYRAVGRLNVAGTRFCTATLIGPAIIATAAHCLYHPRTRARVPLSELRFVAGLRLDRRAAVRRLVRAAIDPDFAFDGMADFAGVRADLAVLELDAPIPEAVAPIRAAPLAPGDAPLAIVSYARDRPQAPSIEAPCVLAATFGGVAALDCAVGFGGSGAPVLQQGEGGSTRLVAVVSAIGRVLESDRDVTLAVLVGPGLEALLAALPDAPRED